MQFDVDGKATFAYSAGHALDLALPSVVFIHGAAHDHSVWSLQSRYFAFHRRNVLALDLPGHGRSAGPPLASVQALADWTVRLLDRAAIARAALVGHSLGGLIALEMAARHPPRVARLALLGVSLPMPVSDAFLDAARRNDHAAFVMDTIWGHAPETRIGGDPVPGMWLQGKSMRLLERSAPGVLYTDLKACNDYADGERAAAQVGCPVLFILGRRDAMTPPRATAEAARRIAGSRTVWLEAAGHAMTVEQPDAVLDALIEFL